MVSYLPNILLIDVQYIKFGALHIALRYKLIDLFCFTPFDLTDTQNHKVLTFFS